MQRENFNELAAFAVVAKQRSFTKAAAALGVSTSADGQVVFNTVRSMVSAALAGFGIAFVPEDTVLGHIANGELVQVLDDWCQPFAGFHLYYPSRRQNSPAFQVIAEALRYRE